MGYKISPGDLIAQVNGLHSDMVSNWGKSWKTELLERLTAKAGMEDAWNELAKRSHHPSLENADNYTSIYGLCSEFMNIRRDAFKAHPTPKDRAERFHQIAKNATWLAMAIDDTRLDRIADPFLEVKQDKPTPSMTTILKLLSLEAEKLSVASREGPNLLKRPGGATNSTRTYVIRRLAILFDRLYGGHLQRTLASFAQAILGEEREVTVAQVNSALQDWIPVDLDSRGEYL